MSAESTEANEPRNEAMVDEGAAESGEAPRSSSKPPGAPPPEVPAIDADPLAQAQAEATRLRDAWLRTAADFDNFRKRARRELEEARRGGREDLLRSLLPVFDNLDRALQSSQRSTDVKAMAEGLSMVQRQFVDALGREGITRVPTVGHPFDPNLHEAIQQVETDSHPPGTVIAEVQFGYMQGDRLLRAAMVVVARPKPSDPDRATDSGEPAN
jgi:molecular chaperone GrpE